jgi:hypothetical protein
MSAFLGYTGGPAQGSRKQEKDKMPRICQFSVGANAIASE